MFKIIKLIILLLLYIFTLSNTLALNKNDVDVLFNNIENKFASFDIGTQKTMYKKIKTKVFILKVKNKESENIILINYLYSLIYNKHKEIIDLSDNNEIKVSYILYDNIIWNMKKNTDIKWILSEQDKSDMLPIHATNEIMIKFHNDLIKYSNSAVYDDVTDDIAIDRIKNKYDNELTDWEINTYLINSINTTNILREYKQNCTFKFSDKAKLIEVFNRWKVWTMSTNDLDFGVCEMIHNPNIVKVENKFLNIKLQNQKNTIDKLKIKYFNELDWIEIKLNNFKEKYNVWENVDWTIELTNLSEKFIAKIYDWNSYYYDYRWINELQVYENNEYNSWKKYYNEAGIRNITIYIYAKDWLPNSTWYDYSGNELESYSLKKFNMSLEIINNPNIKYINWLEVDSSYDELPNNLFSKHEKIYYLDKSGKYQELIWLKEWEFKVFNDFIYSSNQLIFERFNKYTYFELITDYNSFTHVYWDYYQDNNNIYIVNDFHNSVKTIKQGSIKEVNEGCFGQYIIIDQQMYKSWNWMWDSCNEIEKKYHEYNLIEL